MLRLLPSAPTVNALCRGADVAIWLALLSVLAGCASGPGSDRGAGPTARTPAGVPPVVARHPDRDGPPVNPPAELLAAAASEPRIEPIRSGGANKPYTALGQRYTPEREDLAFRERGLASWYGTRFHGRRTASGELYSVYGLTAAHRTLPIPSYARVRHVASGKEVIVRINDRGPFHRERVIDLSYAAAHRLGITGGLSEVEVERLTFDEIRSGAWRRGTPLDPTLPGSPESEAATLASGRIEGGTEPVTLTAGPTAPAVATPPATPPVATEPAPARAYTTAARGFWVQLAALTRRDGVERLQQRIATDLHALQPLLAVFQEASLFKLQVGPYASREQAHAAARQAQHALQVRPVVIERR